MPPFWGRVGGGRSPRGHTVPPISLPRSPGAQNRPGRGWTRPALPAPAVPAAPGELGRPCGLPAGASHPLGITRLLRRVPGRAVPSTRPQPWALVAFSIHYSLSWKSQSAAGGDPGGAGDNGGGRQQQQRPGLAVPGHPSHWPGNLPAGGSAWKAGGVGFARWGWGAKACLGVNPGSRNDLPEWRGSTGARGGLLRGVVQRERSPGMPGARTRPERAGGDAAAAAPKRGCEAGGAARAFVPLLGACSRAAGSARGRGG